MANLKGDLEQLKRHRENNSRGSREVIQIWSNSISSNIENLGKEKHIVLEQVCIAAIDCYQLRVAEKCIQELNKEFPKQALQILNDIIKVDGTNSSARKRKIAICKALGRNSDAIKELVEYLKTFMADVEAWQELSELYLNEYDYGKAAFCVEELLLHNPHNHLLHQRYADIKYSQGGLENIEIARTYYHQALKLNQKNMRALYGVYLSTSSLLNNQKVFSGKKRDAALKIVDWSLKEIKNRYSEASTNEIEESLAALEV
ncbi:hypothetical protein JTB14_009987 [Gonioctena quinquepunctata]|nr:hypothetical protein JTB14_009987 [Gonioctena quinquepunctata]